MKQSRIVIAFCLLVLISVFIWRSIPLAKTKQPVATTAFASPTASIDAKPANQVIEQVIHAFRAPIAFYGKVIDQYGAPVPDADVGYTAADKFNASGSHYTGKSDAEGFFEISGIKGAGLLVGVGKLGYYPVEGKSSGSFAYGMGPDSYRQAAPTKENPAIFLLHKMGETEPLAHVGARQYKVAKNGQPMEVDLETGSQVAEGQGDIRFERWANDHARDERRRFDWRFRITVPDGGIAERQDQFAFEAPKDGYQNVVEINMPASLGDSWNNIVDKSYFIKIRDGRYARINATIYGGYNNSLFLESFVNPNRDSRNLEFDPKKVVRFDNPFEEE